MEIELLRKSILFPRNDPFTLVYRTRFGFDFPIHYNDGFKLNFIQCKWAKKVICNLIQEITDLEFVVVGPDIQLRVRRNQGFDSVLELMSIYYDLSGSPNTRTCLNKKPFTVSTGGGVYKIMRCQYSNFAKSVPFSDAAKLAGTIKVSLGRLFRLRNGKTLVNTLDEIKSAMPRESYRNHEKHNPTGL